MVNKTLHMIRVILGFKGTKQKRVINKDRKKEKKEGINDISFTCILNTSLDNPSS